MGFKILLASKFLILDLWQTVQAMFSGTNQPSAEDLKNASNTLDNIRPYIHYQNAVGNVFADIKWGAIKFFYSFAKWMDSLATKTLDMRGLLDAAGVNSMIQGYITGAATALTVAALIWVGFKMMLGKSKTRLPNVVLQAIISIFLIFNLQAITNWLVDQSTTMYQSITDPSTSVVQSSSSPNSNAKGSLPFQFVQQNTNDLATLFNNNWQGYGTKDSGKIKNQYIEHYGNNNWTEDEFDALSPTDLSTAITPDQADKMEEALEKAEKGKTLKVKPKYLAYQLVDAGDKPTAIKINKNLVPLFNTWPGGYARYSTSTLAVLVSLFCLGIAYAFITFVIAKTFIDLAIMQVLSLIIFSTDMESGEKTKAVVTDIFMTSLTIALQGFELAFYRIVVTWVINGSHAPTDPIVKTVAILAATIILMTGSQKAAKFFGVDTGAQKGYAMGAMAVNQTMGIGKKVAGLAKVGNVINHKARNGVGNVGAGLNEMVAAREQGSSWIEAAHTGVNAGHAHSQLKKDFLAAGGSRHQWNKAVLHGDVDRRISQETGRMKKNDWLTDKEYNAINKPDKEESRYDDLALKHGTKSDSNTKMQAPEGTVQGRAQKQEQANKEQIKQAENPTKSTNDTTEPKHKAADKTQELGKISDQKPKNTSANTSSTASSSSTQSAPTADSNVANNNTAKHTTKTENGDNSKIDIHRKPGTIETKLSDVQKPVVKNDASANKGSEQSLDEVLHGRRSAQKVVTKDVKGNDIKVNENQTNHIEKTIHAKNDVTTHKELDGESKQQIIDRPSSTKPAKNIKIDKKDDK